MAKIVDASQIDAYIEKLQICYDQAVLTCEEKEAEVNNLTEAFNCLDDLFKRLEVYWKRLENTNEKAKSVCKIISSIQSILNKLKCEAVLDVQAMEALTAQSMEISTYTESNIACISELIMAIDMIQNSNLNKDGAIIKAIHNLKAAYDELLDCMIKLLNGMLELLQYVYSLQCRIIGPVSETPVVLIDCDAPNTTGNTTNPNSPDYIDPVCGDGISNCEGLIGSAEAMGTTWRTFFPIDNNCAYFKQTDELYTETKTQRTDAQTNLFDAKKELELARAKKEGFKKSLDAAKAAKAC